MTIKKRRVLVVGTGVMGSHHCRVVANSPRTELSGIVEMNPELGKKAAERFGTHWYESIPNLGDFDAVIIATPTETHFEIAKVALQSKVSILVEKPLTNSLETTYELLELARKNQAVMMCGLLERFNPAVLTAAKMKLSPSHISSVRHSPYTPRIRTGVAWDLLIHDLDLVSRFSSSSVLPEVKSFRGLYHPNSPFDSEDIADCLLRFENGMVANCSASRVAQMKIRRMSLTLEDRVVELDLNRRDVTVYRNGEVDFLDSGERGYRQQSVIEIPEITDSTEPLVAQLEHFINLIDGISDPEIELNSLIPAHEIVSSILNDSNPVSSN